MDCLDSDIIVAGGGLAGALATFLLMEQGLSVTWVSPPDRYTSTRAAAGVMNPVTGRSFTLSWKFRDLLLDAKATYRSLEARSKSSILHSAILLRSLPTPAEENGWCIRLSDPVYAEYMSEPEPIEHYPFLKGGRSLGVVDPVWRVDMQGVVDAVRKIGPRLVEGYVTSDRKMVVDGAVVELPRELGLVLATGAGPEVADSLALPLRPFKGEALVVSSPDIPEGKIIYHDLKVVPLGGARFWVGPSDPRGYADAFPSAKARKDLIHRFEAAFDVSYEVLAHEAGTRPASVRRRPFAGALPGVANTWVINGLGTKGASLAPWAVRKLVRSITEQAAPDPELNWPWMKQT